MADLTNESHPRDRFRIRPGEALAVLLFWAFLAGLTATGRLFDPRLNERPQVTAAFISLAFIEYAIWALLTVPIFVLAARVGRSGRLRLGQAIRLIIIGIIVAIAVDAVLDLFRDNLLGPPPGRGPRGPFIGILRFQYLQYLMVYFAVLGAGFARTYFLRDQARAEETRQLQAHTAQLQARLAEAQLAVLRTQINPHFLFNTLHAISSLVERDPRGVRRMIARLSDLLRYTLENTGEQEIPLDRELELLQRYLDIMSVRFQGRLDVALNVDDDVRDALVPNLVLQPLVENAFKHGVDAAETAGRVEINAFRRDDSVVLRVRDNGPGPSNNGSSNGVGLRNTIARLSQLYGAKQRFSLERAEGGGAVAEVVLPYHTASPP